MLMSTDVQAAMQRFYDSFSAGDVEGVAATISTWARSFVIGTDTLQWEESRDAWVAAYEGQIHQIPGIRLEAGHLQGYAEGTMGWVADRPNFILPDGTTIPTRLTAVLRQEDDVWKLVNAHFSVAIPDDMLIEMMQQQSDEQHESVEQ